MTKSAHRTRRREAECREKYPKLAEESLVPPVVLGPPISFPSSHQYQFGSMNQQPIQPYNRYLVSAVFR
uniref:Putative ovule protein n=1 Tax=Solanum chacoense TaxID=4108 RepID=A0A0V0HS46_SOLCH